MEHLNLRCLVQVGPVCFILLELYTRQYFYSLKKELFDLYIMYVCFYIDTDFVFISYMFRASHLSF